MPWMIIKDLRVTLLRTPFTEPPRWSTSYGQTTIKACLEELIKQLVIGRHATAVEGSDCRMAA